MSAGGSHLVIGGELVPGKGEPIVDIDPATGEEFATVDSASLEQVDAAVEAARAALGGEWGRMDSFERRRRIERFADAVIEHAMDIGTLSTSEVGMPMRYSVGEVLAASDYLRHFAGHADKVRGAVVPTPVAGDLTYTLRQPVGVVAAITAWNVPSMLTAFKLGPALAAGCSVVLKPAELAPLASRAYAELAIEAGLPAGVLNCVTGGPDVGSHLVSHPGVDKITFTGGTEIGRRIATAAAQSFKRITLELGGKSANIVFADADLDAAVDGACRAVFLFSGQQCIAGSRLFVQQPIFDEFVERYVAASSEWAPGDPTSFDTATGPVISAAAVERIQRYVDGAVAAGATVHCGGAPLRDGIYARGSWYPPTILTGVPAGDPLCTDEIFGPVVSVQPFETEDEVVAAANASSFGLAGGLWTRDLSRAHRVAAAVHTGTMWVNTYSAVTPGAPFGGVGNSGMGREGGIEAVHAFTEVKTVHIGGIT
ncbi:MAG: aldehyde dehydrogenase family protein [Acidimicrobiia bacterium]|nr:aldehyde dehydrogenase family protein [Acidimicrobiia bacterium]